MALQSQGKIDEAIVHYQRVVELKPDFVPARYNLGLALASRGRLEEAIFHYQKVLQTRPDDEELLCKLGDALALCGRYEDALVRYRQVLASAPNLVPALCGVVWLRAACPLAPMRNTTEAIKVAQRANKLCKGKRPEVLDALAAAYAEAGMFSEARPTARKALELARQQKDFALAKAIKARLTLYEAGRTYRQTPTPKRLP
jgi:tetratricopeptide (TPR) repeat protein